MGLRKLRESKCLTQKDLASKLKIQRSTVSMWENKKSTPTFCMLKCLSEALEVDVSEIVECFNS